MCENVWLLSLMFILSPLWDLLFCVYYLQNGCKSNCKCSSDIISLHHCVKKISSMISWFLMNFLSLKMCSHFYQSSVWFTISDIVFGDKFHHQNSFKMFSRHQVIVILCKIATNLIIYEFSKFEFVWPPSAGIFGIVFNF